MTNQRRLTRAEYEQLKANCAARINLQMERLRLNPAQVQRLATQAALDQQQEASISMQDLAAYRACRTLPKGAKLRALAAVLQLEPKALVPAEHQSGRTLVARKVDHDFDGRIAKVETSHAYPGYSWAQVRVMLPTEKAYKFVAVAQRQHIIEEMRRCGHSEEEIKGHFEAAAARAEVG